MNEYFPANGFRLKRPFWHPAQKRGFDRSADAPKFALFHEPRCGKSDICVAKAAYLHSLGHLYGVVAIAWPGAAHAGWVRDAFPDACPVPWQGLVWSSTESATKAWTYAFERLLRYQGLAVLAMNVEALITKRAKETLARFCRERRLVMVINDESSSTANADARRTRTMLSLGSLPVVKHKIILDGTPVDRKGPLDYYSQVGFLDFDILGYPNEVEFKAHYAAMETNGRLPFWRQVATLQKEAEGKGYPDPKEWAIKRAKGSLIEEDGRKRKLVPGRDFWEGIAKDDEGSPIFRNMDELHSRLEPYADRCTFAQAFPDASRPVFTKRIIELTPEQRRVYTEIEEEYRAMLHDGTEIKAAHHLTRTLRLQQVASNYYPDQKILRFHELCEGLGCEACHDTGVVESEQPLRLIDPHNNPRLDAVRFELAEDRPTIVWGRFRQDVEFAMEACRSLGRRPCRYDGTVKARDKVDNREGFQAGRYDTICGNWAAMSRGIPLHRAHKHVVMTNGWSFRTRRQGEERAEHGSKKFATSVVDIIAVDTVDDQQISPALRQGMDVSTMVLRDAKREWL